jgi:undecaprenyl-diphosphatase
MGHFWAVVLGVAQGVAEFLPISSTAHLKMIPWLFGIEGQYSFLRDAHQAAVFDIALHAGSFVAILLALWPDWVDLVKSALGSPRPQRRTKRARFSEAAAGADPLELAPDPMRDTSFARKFLLFLLVTSVPGALFGVAFDDKIEKYSTPAFKTAENVMTGFKYAPVVVGVCLIIFGVLLWAVDRFMTKAEPLESMTWSKALLVGIAQAAALIPGVSRSGSTMTAGRALGLSRDATARYSFMAALPIIGGAAVFGLRDVALTELLSLDWVLGFTAAAITSVVLMRWMLNYVRNHSFSIFMWYRIAAGVLLIAVFFSRG